MTPEPFTVPELRHADPQQSDPTGARLSDNDHPRVLVVGAGFAGLRLAKELSDTKVETLMVDRHNYHTFQPLLYQVATAGLNPENVASSVREIIRDHKNVKFRKGSVVDVDFDERSVVLKCGTQVPYDFLVIAAGASTNFFGVDGARDHSFPIKNLMNAINLRTHILNQFEQAQKDPSSIQDGQLNFVIVGGGPTGVETAGSLVELFEHVLADDYPELDVREQTRVILIEMLPDLLSPYDDSLGEYTLETLRERDVEVMLEESVVEVTPDRVRLESGATIPTRTLIWAAGVQANPLADQLDAEQTEGGRVMVNSDLRLPDRDRVFVMGDMAASTDEEGNLHPQLAPVALQHGSHVARQIQRLTNHQPTQSFRFDDPGKMATIGRNEAVAELPYNIRLTGFPAWVLWVFLHIAKLIGFRNKMQVFLGWVYNYFTYNRASRLILDVNPESDDIPLRKTA